MVPLYGNKDFYDVPILESMSDTTDANSPSMAQLRLFGTSGPEIAESEREYQEMLIPFQSHQFIASLYSMQPQYDRFLFILKT